MNVSKILVPIDFSECSTNALKYALQLRKTTNASLKIIHGYRIPIPAAEIAIDFDIASMEEYKRSTEEKFEIMLSEVPELAGENYEYQMVMAFARDAIVESAKNEIDLIIMGTKGVTNKMDQMLGSNTASVIKSVDCPVLAIPQNARFESINNISRA